jgi:hypothetical protein
LFINLFGTQQKINGDAISNWKQLKNSEEKHGDCRWRSGFYSVIKAIDKKNITDAVIRTSIAACDWHCFSFVNIVYF